MSELEKKLDNTFSNWRKRFFALTMNPTARRNIIKHAPHEVYELLQDAWEMLCEYKKNYVLKPKTKETKMKDKKVVKHLKHDIKESKKSIKEDKALAKVLQAKKKK